MAKSTITKHVLLDPRVVDRVEGAHLTPGPVRKDPCNPLFVEDRTWEIQFDNLYPNVLFDRKEGLFKCWYNISVSGPEESETALCYATSPDGVHWEKPNLDLVEFGGSRANNIVVRSTHGAGVFEDPLDPDPDRRFKMFTRARAEGDSIREMGVSWSADGVRWAPPLICPHIRCRGDTHNNAFWDARSDNFVGITRRIDGIPGVIGQRIVARAESADFCSWSDAAEALRGDLRRQTYAMIAFPYANLYLGLLMMFDVDSDTVDCEIAQSPDTYRWERVCAGQPLIPRGPDGGYDHGCIYAAAHPIFRDGEMLLYYGGSDQGHGVKRKGSLCRARLRADGFAAMEPRERGVTGVVVTNPMLLCGSGLRVTADASGGALRVGILGADRFAVHRSRSIQEDVTDAAVTWKDGGDLTDLRGGSVRLVFELNSCRLYSFSFVG